MSTSSGWPAGIDISTPSAARIYDYALGGAHNFAADRAAAQELLRVMPDALTVAQANRAFLQRAVRYCCRHGITQFLDLGSGIPTVGNVHEVAQRFDPACRVVYVDNDPVSVATTQHLLLDVPNSAIVAADMRDVDAVLGAPETRWLLDFDKPVGLVMAAVLHYLSDEDAAEIVTRYRAALVPGSFLVISHTTEDPLPEVTAVVRKVFDETSTPVVHRSHAEVAAFLDGLELVEPGVVWAPQWQPDADSGPAYDDPESSVTFAAIGRVVG